MLSDPMKGLIFKSLRSKQIATLVAVATIFITVISLGVYEGNKKSVTLTVNGEIEEVKTYAQTVGKLLSEQEIEVAAQDEVTPSMNTPVEDGLSVRWEQAKEVAIEIDDREDILIWTTKKKVSDVLEEANIELTEFDKVSPDLQAQLKENGSITVEKAYQFTLIDGGEESKYWSTSTTVADFLKNENIELDKLDRLEGSIDDLIKPGSTVQIVRVEKVTDVVEETANFAIETRNDKTLLKGHEKVVQQGEEGTVSREYEVTKEDGKEVSRKLTEEKIIKEPTKKIVAVGTKVVVASASSSKSKPNKSAGVGVSRSDSAPSGGKEFYVSATAYTAHCNGCSGITATGINLKTNPDLKVIAVDPSVIPLGTKVWVEGYGHAIAGDTGGAIKGNKVDLHFPTKEAAYKFGKRQVKVKIIN